LEGDCAPSAASPSAMAAVTAVAAVAATAAPLAAAQLLGTAPLKEQITFNFYLGKFFSSPESKDTIFPLSNDDISAN